MFVFLLAVTLPFRSGAQVPAFGIPIADPGMLEPGAPNELINHGRDLEVIESEGSRYESHYVLRHIPDSMVRITANYGDTKKPVHYYFAARKGAYYWCNRRGRIRRSYYRFDMDDRWTSSIDTSFMGDTMVVRRSQHRRANKDSVRFIRTESWAGGRLLMRRYQDPGIWDEYSRYIYDGSTSITRIDSISGPITREFRVERKSLEIHNGPNGLPDRVIKRFMTPDGGITSELTFLLRYENGVCVYQEMTTGNGEVYISRLRFL